MQFEFLHFHCKSIYWNYFFEINWIICFVKVMTWTSGLTFTLILIFIVTIIAYNFIQKCCRGNRIPSEKKIFVNLIYLLENSFSFVEIIDSKFIGLFIFVFANILTGLVNLTMHPHERSEFEGYFIMCVYTFLSLFVPFFYYYFETNVAENCRLLIVKMNCV